VNLNGELLSIAEEWMGGSWKVREGRLPYHRWTMAESTTVVSNKKMIQFLHY